MNQIVDKKLIIQILLQNKTSYLFKFLTSILLRGSLLVLPIFYSIAVNEISNGNYKMAIYMVICSVVLTLIYRIGEHYNQLAFYRLYNGLYQKYTELTLTKTHQNSIYSLSRISLGEFTNILNSDIDIISGFWSNAVIRTVQVLEFLFIFGALFLINFYIGAVAFIVCSISFTVLLLYGNKLSNYNSDRKEKLDQKTSILHELFLGIKEIKGLNIATFASKRATESTDVYLKSNAKFNIKYNQNRVTVLFIMEFFRFALFGYGIYLIMKGQMELGTLLIIYNYFAKMTDNINELGVINMEYRNVRVSTLRFQKILEYSKKQDQKNDQHEVQEGKIVFSNVLYGNREEPILNGLSFTALPNSITVLAGKSKTDKEGVFDLLLRLNRQHEGMITIDETDIQNNDEILHFSSISVVRENPGFLKISIKENLELINSNFSRMVEVCKKLGIHQTIMKLKNGYDTIMNDASYPLDEELLKLLAVARVLLKNSKIILISDIFSSFDSETNKNLLNILEEWKAHHTIILISKDPVILRAADTIVPIENGKNTED